MLDLSKINKQNCLDSAKLLHDQSLSMVKLGLKQFEYVRHVENFSNALEVYSNIFLIQKVQKIKNTSFTLYESLKTKTGTALDNVKYGVGIISSSAGLVKGALKTTIIFVKQNWFPIFTPIKVLSPLTQPLSLLATGFGVIKSGLSLHTYKNFFKQLPSKKASDKEKLEYIRKFREEAADTTKKQRAFKRIESHAIEATDTKVVKAFESIANRDSIPEPGQPEYINYAPEVNNAVDNAHKLLKRKTVTTSVTMTASLCTFIALGVLFAGVAPPLIPVTVLAACILTETGVGMYEIFGLKRNLKK